MDFGENIVSFYKKLKPPHSLPEEVEVLYPYRFNEVAQTVEAFFSKYFNDTNARVFLIGINPGRFGGGTTGIPFTDPVKLENHLGLANQFDKRPELSSNFIYKMIDSIGGPVPFYESFYITSVSPLGFTKNGRNLNYYDIPELQQSLEGYMVGSLKEQITWGAQPVAYSLGMGKNIKYLMYLNKKYGLFEEVRPLPHPRWIMQYRLKMMDEFLQLYKNELEQYLTI